MPEGVDLSFSRPGGKLLAEHGKSFVGRYLFPNPGGPGHKGITEAEFNDYDDHGVLVFFIYEGIAGGMRRGYNEGVADAKRADTQLKQLSRPDNDRPIYFAKDYDGSLGGNEQAYLKGVAAVLGHARTGIYGGFEAIEQAFEHGLVSWGFQTYAWSGGRVSSHANVYQYHNGVQIAGSTVDLCRSLKDEYGQHPVGHAAPATHDEKASKPAPLEQYVTAGKGDGLSAIAARHGVKLAQIEHLNPQIKPPKFIVPIGARIRVR